MKIFADKYKEMKKQDPGAIPVDAFGGYVPFKKYDKNNLSEVQENIMWKTGLGSPMEYELKKKGVK